MNKISMFLTGTGLGAGLVYLLDPGLENRRAEIRDKAVKKANEIGRKVESTANDLQRQAINLVADAKARLSPEISDEDLAARLQSKLAWLVAKPTSIEVTVEDGLVTLKGSVFGHETDRLLSAFSSTRGVGAVENQLEVRPAEEGMLTLRSGAPETLEPTAKLLVGVAGAALALYVIRRPNIINSMLGAIGVAILSRGLAQEPPASNMGGEESEERADVQDNRVEEQPAA